MDERDPGELVRSEDAFRRSCHGGRFLRLPGRGLRRIVDYTHLSGYLRDPCQQPGIAETVNFDQIKRHYYGTHDDPNPGGIVPAGPEQDLTAAHHRESLDPDR